MDNNTSIQELKKLVQDFCEERDWSQFHNPKDLVIGISTEANELLQIFRFKDLNQINEMFNNELKREAIEDELSDVLYFILRFAQMNDIDLTTSLKSKINKNNIKYSVEKSKGNNLKYNER